MKMVMVEANVSVLFGPGQTCELTVAEGTRCIAFAQGHPLQIGPELPAGDYDIDGVNIAPNCSWPVVVMAAPIGDVEKFASLPQEVRDRFIAEIVGSIESKTATHQ